MRTNIHQAGIYLKVYGFEIHLALLSSCTVFDVFLKAVGATLYQ